MDHSGGRQTLRGMWLRHEPSSLFVAVKEVGQPLWLDRGLGTMLGSLEKLEGRVCLPKCLRIDLVGTAAPEVLQGSCGLCQEKKERGVSQPCQAYPGPPWSCHGPILL